MKKYGFVIGLAYGLGVLTVLGIGNWQAQPSGTPVLESTAEKSACSTESTDADAFAQEEACVPAPEQIDTADVSASPTNSLSNSNSQLAFSNPAPIVTPISQGNVFAPGTALGSDTGITFTALQPTTVPNSGAADWSFAVSPVVESIKGRESQVMVLHQIVSGSAIDANLVLTPGVTFTGLAINDNEISVCAAEERRGVEFECSLPPQATAISCQAGIDALAPSSPSEEEANTLQSLREKLVELIKVKTQLQGEQSLQSEISRIEIETANLRAAKKIVEARQALQKIIDEFPDSPGAKAAKSMLEININGLPAISTLPIY